MSNGITYVTPDPCPHCGGRVSTGIAGDEDSEKCMYVCGQCDTWFEQKGYPTTSKRYVTEETEVNALRARVAELEILLEQKVRCQCGDDEACAHVRRVAELEAENQALKQEKRNLLLDLQKAMP